MDDEDEWKLTAACRGQSRLFFSENKSDIGRAKRICDECPVKLACRQYSLIHHEPVGTWGGLSERERRKLLKYVGLVDLESLSHESAVSTSDVAEADG